MNEQYKRMIHLSEKRVRFTDHSWRRYLSAKIVWEERLIIIKGARGTGKTTLLLQRLKSISEKGIYLSMDDFFFETHRLSMVIEELYAQNYRQFFIDEVHQYEFWSKDFKTIYDNFPDIHLVVTSSSILQIDKGNSDLSRRAVLYTLFGLSFREFLALEGWSKIPQLSLKELLENHVEIAAEINDQLPILKHFSNFLEYGAFPFYRQEKRMYSQKLQQIVQMITEIDIPTVKNINYATVRSMRKLFFILSQNVPYTPNIQHLAEKVGVTRTSILRLLDLMERASVLQLLRSEGKSISMLQKPDKIYLDNTNFIYAFSGGMPNKGNLRETFFLNQLKVNHQVTTSKYSDFMVDQRYTFEIGGKGKTDRQILGIPLAFIAADEIESGQANKIPLWMFGLLY